MASASVSPPENSASGAEDTVVRVSMPSDANIEEQGPTSVPGSLPSDPSPEPTMASTPTPVPTTESQLSGEESKDKDKDRRSLSTNTFTSSKHHFSRRKANKSSSTENVPSSSTHIEKPVTTKKSKAKVYRTKTSKPSLFSRIARRLVPCAGPSPTHSTEVDDAISEESGRGSSTLLKEKRGPKSTERGSGPSQVASTEEASPVPSPSDTTNSLPLAPANPLTVVTPITSEDSVVIIPPPNHLLPESETDGVTSGAVQPPGSSGEAALHAGHSHIHTSGNESDDTGASDDEYEDAHNMEDIEDDEERLIRQGGVGIPIGLDGAPRPLLPPIAPEHVGRKCLVLDLDETLVHSSFKSIQQADYIVPVEIDNHWHNFYVLKRPGVDDFLREMGLIYEVVVFTASLSVYADPVLDKLDVGRAVKHRLFRESCYNHKGNYVKDLSQLGRPIADTIILDNSPASYIFHPNNAVPVSSWFNDPHDTELTDMCPFLVDLQTTEDVRGVLDAGL